MEEDIMKELAFEYAGSFNMPSMKIVKIERENVMFSTPTSVFDYNGGKPTVSDKVSFALSSDIEVALQSKESDLGSAGV